MSRDIKGLLEDFIQETTAFSMRRWRLAIVENFNKETNEVDVKIFGNVKDCLMKDVSGGNDIIFNNVPVRIFGNSENYITHSIKKGDFCELHRIDYDISDFMVEGENSNEDFIENGKEFNWIAVFTIRNNAASIKDWKDGIELNSSGNSFFLSEKGEAFMKVSQFLKVQNKFDVLSEGLSLLSELGKHASTSSSELNKNIEIFNSIATGFEQLASLVPSVAAIASEIKNKIKDLQNNDNDYKQILSNINKIKA
jgi:hypothetical protein